MTVAGLDHAWTVLARMKGITEKLTFIVRCQMGLVVLLDLVFGRPFCTPGIASAVQVAQLSRCVGHESTCGYPPDLPKLRINHELDETNFTTSF